MTGCVLQACSAHALAEERKSESDWRSVASSPEQMAQVTASYAERGAVFIGRTRAQVTGMFNGRELVDPGVVQISRWRPDGGTLPPNAERVWGYAGVARV